MASIGVPDLHFHDLRHTGNMLAAASKATTKDLMARMGHDSMEVALIYRRASREADLSIAAHLNTQLEALDPAKRKPKGKKKGLKATKCKLMQKPNGRRVGLEGRSGIDGTVDRRGSMARPTMMGMTGRPAYR